MRKSLKRILLGLCVVAMAVPAVVIGPFLLRIESFESDPDAGFYAPYYVYVARSAARAAAQGRSVRLLVQPNNTGTPSDDPEVHYNDAWWMAFGRHRLAERLQVVLLIPGFIRPADDWRVYTHALDRDVFTTTRPDLARTDLQLIIMMSQVRDHLRTRGIQLEERVLLQGYSASGMFVNRFVVLHPHLVSAVATGSPGGWPIAPVPQHDGESLPYPAGVSDLAELTGSDFDLSAYQAIPQLIVMGSLDDNDSLDFTDGWDPAAASLVDRLFGADPLSRWDEARRLHEAAGASAEFLLVDKVGHDRSALQEYATRFFERVLSGGT